MKFNNYFLRLCLTIIIPNIIQIDSQINAQELPNLESMINSKTLHNFNNNPENNINFDNLNNSKNLENFNQEIWKLSQHNDHEHHNHNNLNNTENQSQEHNHQETNHQENWEHSLHGDQIFSSFLIDKLEYRVNNSQDSFNWDAIGWVGGDYQRLWLKTEGEVSLEHGDGEAEIQLLYGKLIAPFWDFQAGIRYDQLYGSDSKGRGFAVIGIEGVTPYMFEIDTALFVSHQGDISARFKAEYELLLTQRLVLQPSLETNIALQEVEEFGVGSGFNDIELGLRLRYEITRNFSPYIGIDWTKLLGKTADFAKEEGESVDSVTFVAGVRLLF